MTPVAVVAIKGLELLVFAGLAADACASHYGAAGLHFGGQFDSSVPHGFTRGDDGELRKPVEDVRLLLVEVVRGPVVRDFGAILEAYARGIGGLDWRDAAAPLAQGIPKFRDVFTNC